MPTPVTHPILSPVVAGCERPARRESLDGIAIFRDLAPDIVAALSRRCRWRRYGAGQTIVQYQDEGRDVYFVVRGRVCAIFHSASGREIRFGDLVEGEIFGEFAAIDGAPRTADVVSVTDTLIASMSADQLWDVMGRHESVRAAILRRLTGLARSMLQRVVEFSTLPVRGRLHAELLRLAQVGAQETDRTTAVISPAPTHAEIASRISTHREAVTRELNELARAKLIEKRGKDLIICDIEMLASMVEDPVEECSWGERGTRAKDDRGPPASLVSANVQAVPRPAGGEGRVRRF